jgi:hypothetical protein
MLQRADEISPMSAVGGSALVNISRMDTPPKPEKSSAEKVGLILMIAGFGLILLAAFVAIPRTGNNAYAAWAPFANHLILGGLSVYVLGRVLRWQGKRGRRAS